MPSVIKAAPRYKLLTLLTWFTLLTCGHGHEAEGAGGAEGARVADGSDVAAIYLLSYG